MNSKNYDLPLKSNFSTLVIACLEEIRKSGDTEANSDTVKQAMFHLNQHIDDLNKSIHNNPSAITNSLAELKTEEILLKKELIKKNKILKKFQGVEET